VGKQGMGQVALFRTLRHCTTKFSSYVITHPSGHCCSEVGSVEQHCVGGAPG